ALVAVPCWTRSLRGRCVMPVELIPVKVGINIVNSEAYRPKRVDSVGRVTRVRPTRNVTRALHPREAGVVKHRPGVWLTEHWPCWSRPRCRVSGKHAGWVGMLGMHVQPPLDQAALVFLAHAAVMEQQEPHGRVRAALDPVRR